MSKLATKQDLNKIIEKAVKRIGEDQANIRDTEGVTITNEDIKEERKEVIEESLKEAANEAAEKLVLENTITGMVKDVISEDEDKKKLNILQKFDKFIQSTTMKNLSKKLATPDISMEDWTKALEAYRHAKGRVEDLEGITPEDYVDYKEEEIEWPDPSSLVSVEDQIKTLGDKYADDGKDIVPEMSESTTDIIKKLVSKKLKNISEEKTTTPSLDQVKKHRDESNTETKKYHKDTEKKFKEYSESDKAKEDSPMHRNNEDQEEFIEDWRGMGLEDAEGVGDLERLEAYLGGSSETGNAQVDEDGNDLGNVVSTDLGKKIKKKIERKKEKIETQKSHMRNARGYSPAVQKTVKESVNESIKVDMTKITELFNYNKKTQ